MAKGRWPDVPFCEGTYNWNPVRQVLLFVQHVLALLMAIELLNGKHCETSMRKVSSVSLIMERRKAITTYIVASSQHLPPWKIPSKNPSQ